MKTMQRAEKKRRRKAGEEVWQIMVIRLISKMETEELTACLRENLFLLKLIPAHGETGDSRWRVYIEITGTLVQF